MATSTYIASLLNKEQIAKVLGFTKPYTNIYRYEDVFCLSVEVCEQDNTDITEYNNLFESEMILLTKDLQSIIKEFLKL